MADDDRVNDFALRVATVNGTGSASANGLLVRAIFRMGIPVSGKNAFPSNIQGQPTWYEIRVDADGHLARTERIDLVVAMNPQTYAKDIAAVAPGGWLLHDSTWPLDVALARDDIVVCGIPIGRMCTQTFDDLRTRTLMKNVVYVGALVALLDLDTRIVRGLLEERFSERRDLLDANVTALELGHGYAREHLGCPLPIRAEPMNATDDFVLIDGNTASALGCVYAGATVAAWYPITPATSLMESFERLCERFRRDEEGRRRYIVLRAEDEMAAAGIVIGAAWAGARAFTATSGPGVSLLHELIGLAYYAEIGSVFFDVQRVGPSTGLPTRTQQGDILSTIFASHGDTAHIALFPADPGECFTMARDAFDFAERFQTPVFVLSDIDVGMNDWMVRRLSWDDAYVPDRGKVLTAAELDAIETYHRYLDVDGDGIAARTIPGVHEKGAFLARGSGHSRWGRYTEVPEDYVELLDRLGRKVKSAAPVLPRPIIERAAGAELSIVTLGSCDGAVREAVDRYRAAGVAVDTMRVRAFPFSDEVEGFLREHEHNYVVEQNRDGQLRRLLLLETGIDRDRISSVVDFGGLTLSAEMVMRGVRSARSNEPEVAGQPSERKGAQG